MTNETKRLLCWAPAIAIVVLYGGWSALHWTDRVPPPDSGVTALITIAVIFLGEAGAYLGRERPKVIYIWRPRQPDEPDPVPTDYLTDMAEVYRLGRQAGRHQEPPDELA